MCMTELSNALERGPSENTCHSQWEDGAQLTFIRFPEDQHIQRMKDIGVSNPRQQVLCLKTTRVRRRPNQTTNAASDTPSSVACPRVSYRGPPHVSSDGPVRVGTVRGSWRRLASWALMKQNCSRRVNGLPRWALDEGGGSLQSSCGAIDCCPDRGLCGKVNSLSESRCAPARGLR